MRKGGGRAEGPPPSFLMTVGGNEPLEEFKIGGSMKYLVEMVQIENSLRNYVNFTLRNGVSWAFKTLKPMNFRLLRPMDPQCHDGMKIVQIDNSVRNYM